MWNPKRLYIALTNVLDSNIRPSSGHQYGFKRGPQLLWRRALWTSGVMRKLISFYKKLNHKINTKYNVAGWEHSEKCITFGVIRISFFFLFMIHINVIQMSIDLKTTCLRFCGPLQWEAAVSCSWLFWEAVPWMYPRLLQPSIMVTLHII